MRTNQLLVPMMAGMPISHALLAPQALSNSLLRRESCGSNISSACTTSLQACVDAICTTCQDITGIAQCCALSTDDLISECIANSEQGATQSSIPVAGTATPTSTSTLPASVSSELGSPDATACVSFEAVFDACTSATPAFTGEPFATQASCLCYTSSTWAPAAFDGLFSSCLGFYSTASPAYYSSLVDGSNFGGFAPCSSAGDVAASVSSSPASVLATTTTTTTTSSSSSSLLPTSSASSTSESFVGETVASTSNQAAPSTALASASTTETAASGASNARDEIKPPYAMALILLAFFLTV